MMHNAQKILFTEPAEIKQGDGNGPKFEAGKAYWLSPDQAVRWKAEGVAEDAPLGMSAENEPALTLRPDDVRLLRAGRNRYDVVGPNGIKFNDAPLSAGDAEKLRQRILEQGPPLHFVDPAGAASITLHQDIVGEKKIVSVGEEWPNRTVIDPHFLAHLSEIETDIATVDGDRLLIVVANGHAEYRRLGETEHGSVVYELVASEFKAYEPPQSDLDLGAGTDTTGNAGTGA